MVQQQHVAVKASMYTWHFMSSLERIVSHLDIIHCIYIWFIHAAAYVQFYFKYNRNRPNNYPRYVQMETTGRVETLKHGYKALLLGCRNQRYYFYIGNNHEGKQPISPRAGARSTESSSLNRRRIHRIPVSSPS